MKVVLLSFDPRDEIFDDIESPMWIKRAVRSERHEFCD